MAYSKSQKVTRSESKQKKKRLNLPEKFLRKIRKQPDKLHSLRQLFLTMVHLYKKFTFGTKTFQFQGFVYNYFCHRTNHTWWNERAVEVPIVWEIVKNSRGRVLEVGNCLSYYFPVSHDIVDKFDKKIGVIHRDIVDFQPEEPYDLIVSISTMEHVGLDDGSKKPDKIISAFRNLRKNCVASGGTIVTTCPIGYNQFLDKLLREGKDLLGEKFFMKRVSDANEWIETEWNNVENVEYDYPFLYGNAIVIGIFHNE